MLCAIYTYISGGSLQYSSAAFLIGKAIKMKRSICCKPDHLLKCAHFSTISIQISLQKRHCNIDYLLHRIFPSFSTYNRSEDPNEM